MMIKIVQKPEIDNYVEDLWNIITISYKDIGGCLSYRNFDEFKETLEFARVALNDDIMIACAIYRLYPAFDDSKKMIACGCDQTEIGKIALQDIIKLDIKDKDLHYWVETDGVIEHWFKKYRGYPVPNIIVPKVLGMSSKKIVLDSDKFHYKRSLLTGGNLYRKAMFGFRTDEIFEEVQNIVDDYGEFREECLKLTESQEQSYGITLLAKGACEVIEDILTQYEEIGLRCIMPIVKETLEMARDVLIKSRDNKELNQKHIEYYVGRVEFLLDKLPVVELHKFDL